MLAMIVEVGGLFSEHVAAALVRLRYLHPHATFDLADGGISVATDAGDEERIRRDVNYELYRERILQQTMPLRRALVAGVMGR
jgi:hypothetical protein